MRRNRLVWFVLPLALWMLSSTLQASTVMQLNLGEMVQRADRIFRGTVLSVGAESVSAGGGQLPVAVYRLRVDEAFRGEFPDVKGVRIAEIRTLGKAAAIRIGTVRSAVVLPRMPELEVGRSYLVLGTRPSAIGLSTTVGLGQGLFHISSTGKEDEAAVNEVNNAGLFRGMAAPPARIVRQAVEAAGAGSGAIAYAELATRIRGLVGR